MGIQIAGLGYSYDAAILDLPAYAWSGAVLGGPAYESLAVEERAYVRGTVKQDWKECTET